MVLQVLKERQHETMAWLYTCCWCASALSSILALLYARAEKHQWNPVKVLLLAVLGFVRHVCIFVFGGLSFLLTLYILEIDEGENFMPGFVTTLVPLVYFARSIRNSRRRLQKKE